MKYIIEHETFGVYVSDCVDGRPKFKYSILRSEGKVFDTGSDARTKLYRIRSQGRRWRGVYIFSWEPGKPGRGKYIYPPPQKI